MERIADQIRRPAVVLATASGRWVEPTTHHCAICVGIHTVVNGVDLAPRQRTSAYVEDNRNKIVDYALEIEKTDRRLDGIMWYDTDMVFPHDTLLRLYAHNKPIVGANYRAREHPYPYLGMFSDGEDPRYDPKVPLRPMNWLPGGLLYVGMTVYRKMPPPWYEINPGRDRDDIAFCRKAKELGYEVWCDMKLTAEVRHIGAVEVPWG